jgi:formylglycine-generating enzyme required for sulfatase activity
MLGNVSQWCSSLYEPYPYNALDGRESPSAQGLRVVRGASFADFIESADAAQRHGDRPDHRLRWTGVRLAYSPPAGGPGAAVALGSAAAK